MCSKEALADFRKFFNPDIIVAIIMAITGAKEKKCKIRAEQVKRTNCIG
ncbi:hypothetical protein OXPF_36940 [Oxobacter pfennigii]|uniref:Uncharacterized protein n=2 Tax=Oxobacter pfennigii TaxID=36849 RepID=A0A0P8W5J9_9CLOT|nr:hypothetical protein OXPF_36940 [Oxobacter pfennigii]